MATKPITELLPDLSSNRAQATSSTAWRPELDAYEPSLVEASDRASAFVAGMERRADPHWLTFSGIPGCGKTMLSRQIYRQAQASNPGAASLWAPGGTGVMTEDQRRPVCVWLTEEEFARRLRGGEYDLPRNLRMDWLVAIDDLGSSRDNTAFIAGALFDLCNYRVGRWTLFSTNLKLSELKDRIDPRVASRLIRDDNQFVTIKAGDYALRKRGLI